MKTEEVSRNQRLVALIKDHPILYDPQRIKNSNPDMTTEAWATVAFQLNDLPGECMKTWRSLRLGLSRTLRDTPSSASRDMSTTKKYYLYDDMSFLIPFMRTRGKKLVKTSAPEESADENGSNSHYDESINDKLEIRLHERDEQSDSESINTNNSSSMFFQSFPAEKKPRIYNSNSVSIIENEERLESISPKKEINHSPDPDMNFLLSLYDGLRSLEPRVNLITKRKFLEVIEKAMFEPESLMNNSYNMQQMNSLV